jgi:hypothetical protein
MFLPLVRLSGPSIALPASGAIAVNADETLMPEYETEELARFEWVPSRIPALDALVCFVPEGPPRDAAVDAFATSHRSRWYPMQGGIRVVVSLERNPAYDTTKWRVEKGAWDHEHCDFCGKNIAAITPCWVTKHDPYVLLCDACHGKLALPPSDDARS